MCSNNVLQHLPRIWCGLDDTASPSGGEFWGSWVSSQHCGIPGILFLYFGSMRANRSSEMEFRDVSPFFTGLHSWVICSQITSTYYFIHQIMKDNSIVCLKHFVSPRNNDRTRCTSTGKPSTWDLRSSPRARFERSLGRTRCPFLASQKAGNPNSKMQNEMMQKDPWPSSLIIIYWLPYAFFWGTTG